MEFLKKYCPECDAFKSLNPDYQFCPECGTELIEKLNYEELLKKLGVFNLTRKFCHNCELEFSDEYNFCPICSERLRTERIFEYGNWRDHYLYFKWNDDEGSIILNEDTINNPAINDNDTKYDEIQEWVRNIIMKKYFDKLLENDFISRNQEVPEKLRCFEYEESLENVDFFKGIIDFEFSPHNLYDSDYEKMELNPKYRAKFINFQSEQEITFFKKYEKMLSDGLLNIDDEFKYLENRKCYITKENLKRAQCKSIKIRENLYLNVIKIQGLH